MQRAGIPRKRIPLWLAPLPALAGLSLVMAPADAARAGFLTLSPASGTTIDDDVAFTTAEPCAEPATHYLLTVTGAGFSDDAAASDALDGQTATPVTVPLSDTWNAVAAHPTSGPNPPTTLSSQTVTVTIPDIGQGEFAWSVSGGSRTVVLSKPRLEGTYLRSSGGIRAIEVTDTRPGGPAWSISGQVGDFAGPSPLPGRYLGWTPTVNSWGAGSEPGPAVGSGFLAGLGLTVPSVLSAAEPGHDPGSASLGAGLDLRLPIDTLPGTYTTTLTITALS